MQTKNIWGTPSIKTGISKDDKVGAGQVEALYKHFNKYPIQLLELVKIVSQHRKDNFLVNLPDCFKVLLRWEANWILGKISTYCSGTKRGKKVRRLLEKSSTIEQVIPSNNPVTRRKYKIDYYEYIVSSEWKEKSMQAKNRAGNRCQICNRSSKQVTLHTHHRTYERLGRELDTDLTVLCAGCHKLYEDNKRMINKI